MNYSILLAIIFWLAINSPTHAAGPVTVLGLPVGGKITMPIRECAVREIGTNVRSLCWVDAPSTFKGSSYGMVSVPGSDHRPRWAAYATFNVWVARDGTLETFDVRTTGANDFVEILNSISGRFGQSEREPRAGSAIMSADWTRKDIHITLRCTKVSGCVTSFTSAAKHAEHLSEVAARKAKDGARPLSP
jgi:hypothetical protein